ncbi:MAG: sigma-54-dependent Fis family transcriptional regulator [Desulfobacterales bacterium]|nr:sigma-54-dependent Fis family transcriptional regulator [Desulfobacterales bacterium]
MKKPTGQEGCNILVVDDKPMNMRLLVKMLNEEGYNVRGAPNGERALEELEKQTIHLILLDIRMPGMDGFSVCERIKANASTKNIPVIFISALTETFDKLKAFSSGGVDYITKPFEAAEVLARVRTQLSLVEQRDRLRRLADVSFEGILVHSRGEIVEVNRTLAEMLDRPGEELIGASVFDLLIPASGDLAGRHDRVDFSRSYEARAVKRDGTRFPVEIQAREVTWLGRKARVVAVRDMSWRTVLKRERRTIESALEDRGQFGELVGKSEPMKKVFEAILRTAASDAPALISGETGAGKELTARTIFNMSEQYNRCFVAVNCASIPEHLFESLFFGHKKGAFTGADQDHAGFFKQARGGVLFLDEVGELTLEMQAKLLRALNDFTYTPVGAYAQEKADVRLIASTNRDLRTMVDKKKVRSDFFHRLYVLAVDLPPLRWRKDDIPVLIAHYLRKNAKPGGPLPTIPPRILDRFYEYDWPGNVRELFNELTRFFAAGEVDLSGSPPAQSAGSGVDFDIRDDLPLNRAMENFQRHYLSRVMRRHRGYKGKTADSLKVDRKTLYRKLKKFDLT